MSQYDLVRHGPAGSAHHRDGGSKDTRTVTTSVILSEQVLPLLGTLACSLNPKYSPSPSSPTLPI